MTNPKDADLSRSQQLVPMQLQHIGQVSEIHQHINPSPWNLAQWQSCFENKAYQNWVIVESDAQSQRVVAFACYLVMDVEAELLNIGVAEQNQGKGMGEALLKSSLILLPELTEQCFLEVRRSNLPAINLYQKLEFKQLSVRKNYYRHKSGVVEDALIYCKALR